MMSDKQIMRIMAQILRRSKMTIIQELLAARVPILKVLDPVSSFHLDVCLNNELGHHNTNMLYAYANMESRVRPLCLLVKYWAKRRGINDAYRGTLSSYAYVLMIIQFLQARSPTVLPCLQQMAGGKPLRGAQSPVVRVASKDGVVCNAYFDSTVKKFDSGNQESLGELLIAFLHHFAYEFDFREQVVCPRLGHAIPRTVKGWDEATVALDLAEAEAKAATEEKEETLRESRRGARRRPKKQEPTAPIVVPPAPRVSLFDDQNFPSLGSSGASTKPARSGTETSSTAAGLFGAPSVPLTPKTDIWSVGTAPGAAGATVATGMGYAAVAAAAVAGPANETDSEDDAAQSVATDARREPSQRKMRRVTRHVFCIEDPFDLTHDLGRNLDEETLDVIRHEFVRAHSILVATGDIHRACEKYSGE